MPRLDLGWGASARSLGPDSLLGDPTRVARRRWACLAPSLTLTERIRPHWDRRTQEAQDAEVARTPLRRVAEAADQARVICFLASNDADFVTGVTIDVTGGN